MPPGVELPAASNPELARILESSPVFRGLPDDWVDLLSRAAERMRFPAGHLIEAAGGISTRLYLVASGKVEMFSGDTEQESEIVGRALPGAVFGSGPITNEPEVASYKAAGEVETWAWNRGRLDLLRRTAPRLDDQLRCRVSLLTRQRELLRLLGRSALFASTSPALLRRLLEAATLAKFTAGECVCKEGEEGEYLFLIVQGEVEVVRATPECLTPRVVAVLRRGDCFGEVALLEHATRNATVITLRDSEVLMISRREFDMLHRACASFRRGIRAVAHERLPNAQPSETPEPVWVSNRSAFKSERLIALFSQALNSSGVKVLVLAIGESSASERHRVSRTPEIELQAVHPDALTADVVARTGFDYVLCYSTDPNSRTMPAALRELSPTMLVIAENFTSDLPDEIGPGQMVHYVQLVDSASARGVVRGQAHRGTLRAVLPWRAIAEARELGDLPEAARTFFGRLARMLTRQRVGVALGGGGAWGWAHCAMLRGLHRASIPVDVVAGASFGSVVGAFYASEGLAGLDRLISAMPDLARAFFSAPITTIPLGRFLARHLPTGRLEDLDVTFMPVAVDIRTGAEKVFRSGPIAESVRASCSFPGLIAPVSGKVRYMDACVKDNVPASCLLEDGIDFVVASNVVPPLSVMPLSSGETKVPGWFARFSPLARVRDTLRSMQLMLNDTGSRQASLAAVIFAPDLAEFAITEIRRGAEVIARAEAQLPRFLDEVSDSYRAFCKHRV